LLAVMSTPWRRPPADKLTNLFFRFVPNLTAF
jgi:hypothetical protein